MPKRVQRNAVQIPDHDETTVRKRMARWLVKGVHGGSVVEFAFIALTDRGGKIEFRTHRAPKQFTRQR